MVGFPLEAWLLMACVGCAAVLSALRVLAARVRNETMLHDLRIDVITKRNAYLGELSGRVEDDVIDAKSAKRIEEVEASAKAASKVLTGMAERAAA